MAHTVVNLDARRQPDAALGHGVRSGSIDQPELRQVLAAPWRAIRTVAVEPGGTLGPRLLDASELLLFVRHGAGVARLDAGDVPLKPGSSLAFLLGETLHVEASDGQPLELFVAEMACATDTSARDGVAP